LYCINHYYKVNYNLNIDNLTLTVPIVLVRSFGKNQNKMISTYQEEQLKKSMINARRIQQALLPKKRHFDRLFPKSFTYFQPQYFLSGDFYWIGTRHDLRYIVVGDSSGENLSAALTAVLAINLFQYAIMNKAIKKTTKILNEVNKRYLESFQSSSSDHDYPWIDLSIVCIDDTNKKMYYSSANRKMLHVPKEGPAAIYKAKGTPIGATKPEELPFFETLIIDFVPGDQIYLGSDGFQDQFGGPNDKKFGSQRLHDLLIENSSLRFREQEENLRDEFNCWQGNHSQTDDVCIIGVRL
jgi:serine phosphatase RsbU (regulator of sigma subunit)